MPLRRVATPSVDVLIVGLHPQVRSKEVGGIGKAKDLYTILALVFYVFSVLTSLIGFYNYLVPVYNYSWLSARYSRINPRACT